MTDNTPATLHIDMVSDVVCPWCTIGYQRLQQALKQFAELTVTVTFQPFELNPQMSAEGENINEHIARKYGADDATITENRERLRAIGEAEGIHFNAHSESRIYNTFLAHKLLLKAEEMGCQESLKQALFQAYFGERKDISAPGVLLEIALNNGFSAQQAEAALEDEALSKALREKEQHYLDMGISAVPTFVFNGQFTVSGAQDPSVLSKVIRDILNTSSPGAR